MKDVICIFESISPELSVFIFYLHKYIIVDISIELFPTKHPVYEREKIHM